MSNNNTMSYISAYRTYLLCFISTLKVMLNGITSIINYILYLSELCNNLQEYIDLNINNGVDILLAPLGINNLSESIFNPWFSGYTDAEGYFSFFYRRATTTACRFELCIALHRDEAILLTALQKRLNLGNVMVRGYKATLIIGSKAELLILFGILENNTLNSSKYLNYLSFKQAYEIYHKCISDANQEGIDSASLLFKTKKELLGIRSTINKRRINFIMPKSHNIKITPYWILGFVEGDGSFNVRTRGSTLIFGIVQAVCELILMKAIQQYLLSLPGNHVVRSKSKLVALYIIQPSANSSINQKAFVKLDVTDTKFIKNVVVPFFDSLTFLSKKRLDYRDWVSILRLRINGQHFTEEGQLLIPLIAQSMNNGRLSTNKAKPTLSNSPCFPLALFSQHSRENKENQENKEYSKSINLRLQSLLNSPSNYAVQADGRTLIVSMGTYLPNSGGVELYDEVVGVLFNSFTTQADCASFLELSRSTVSRWLIKGRTFEFKGKLLRIQRKANTDELS